jgi:PST family polysaccharide transporter
VTGWFGTPGAANLMFASCLLIVVSSLGSQQVAVLARQRRVVAVSAIEVLTTLVAACVSVAIGLATRNVWALYALTAIYVGGRTISAWALSDWRPSFPPHFKGARRTARIGLDIAAVNVLNFGVRNVDNLIIGRFLGPAQLGFYDQAYRLHSAPMQLMLTPMQRVFIPALADKKSNAPALTTSVRRSVFALTLTLGAFFAFMGGASVPIVDVLLGDAWQPSAQLLAVLAVAGVSQTWGAVGSWLYVVTGRTRVQLKWALFSRPLKILLMVGGLPWGTLGVATMYAFGDFLLLWPALFLAARGSAVRGSELVRWTLVSSTVPLTVFSATLIASHGVEMDSSVATLGAVMTIAGAAWLASTLVISEGRTFLRNLLALKGRSNA